MLPILSAILPIIGSVLEKVIPNKAEAERAKIEIQLKLAENETELLKLFTEIDKGQLEINKEEAKSSSLFVSGWRPYIGWVCGFGVSWAYVLKPVFDWILVVAGSNANTPSLQTGELMSLLLGLLGMGALRSFEKVKNVASK